MNDNYGRWQSDFNEVIQHCKDSSSSAAQIIQWLQPETSDYFVLKPQFSGFFYTPLDLLLRELDVRSLLITGIAGNMCVQFTASDAYMRGYALHIPEDTTASSTADQHKRSIAMFTDVLGADTTASDQINFIRLLKRADEHYAKMN
ncbi:cysteine hydrolase family protein [Geomicrobium sp. JCM 19039]|uniref:cysteine hydrolase family protein n=1 Tax=Geomicrobium sp. JCM 19039 TaxID=1460636 RepID=UPI000B21E0A3|nr:cysteine hydrolase [Geomicrobium sp. JCM 19039]